jgi:hypothetical protein
MMQKSNIRVITDSYTDILLYDDNPLAIHWNSKRQGGPSFFQVLEDNVGSINVPEFDLNIDESIEDIFENRFTRLNLFTDGDYEILIAKSVKKKYEMYYKSNQRHYSSFVQMFNQKNYDYYSIPIVNTDFYYTYSRFFNWRNDFYPLITNFDKDLNIACMQLLESGKRPFITIFQSCISQKGIYEDGSSWYHLHKSPYFIIHGNHLYEAYKKQNIKPNFILVTQKIKGDGYSEYLLNKNLINKINSLFLDKEKKDLIQNYLN